MISLLGLDPADWKPHPLHDSTQVFIEKNCYADILIEYVAAIGGDPLAMLGGAVAVDFEHDQWTFFKPSAEELFAFYGLDVHEMQPYRPLPEQAVERLSAGETLIVELDSFHLPDTAPQTYRQEHVKSSVVIEAIDPGAETMRYFHNAGYFELSGADYRAALRLDPVPAPEQLPPYTELVCHDRSRMLGGAQLVSAARDGFDGWLDRRPATNPVERFGRHLEAALPGLIAADLAAYHGYAFATARMAGSAFELLAAHLRWMFDQDAEPAAAALDQLVGGCKMLVFRLARRRTFDVVAVTGPMADQWQQTMAALDALTAR